MSYPPVPGADFIRRNTIAFSDWVNVLKFGADPTGSTDSTTAIQNAINTANGGGSVYFPSGTYLTQPLTVPPAVNLVGNNAEAYYNATTTIPNIATLSRLKLKAASSSAILSPNDTGTNLATAVSINNLMLDCNTLAQSAVNIPDTGSPISRFWTLNGCYVTNSSGSVDGVYIGQNNTGCRVNASYVFNGQSGSAAGGNGIAINGTDAIVTDSWVGYWGTYGILVQGGTSPMSAIIRGGGCFGTGFAGIGVGGSGVLIDGVSIDTNQQNGVYIANGTGPGTTIIGCQFHGNGSSSANTFPNINVAANSLKVNVIGCRSYGDGSGAQPNYMISIGGTGAVINEAGNEGDPAQFGTGWTNYVGTVSAPAFPANATAVKNTLGVDVQAFITNGAGIITNMQLGSTVTGWTLAASGTGIIRIPNGQSIEFAYASGTPTWSWVAG